MGTLKAAGVRSNTRAWVILDELVREVYQATRGFPAEERVGLGRSLRQAAVAAAVRLVAGEGPHQRPGPVALDRAETRLAELRYYLYLARRLRLLDVVTYRTVITRHDQSLRTLDRLRASAGQPATPRREPA